MEDSNNNPKKKRLSDEFPEPIAKSESVDSLDAILQTGICDNQLNCPSTSYQHNHDTSESDTSIKSDSKRKRRLGLSPRRLLPNRATTSSSNVLNDVTNQINRPNANVTSPRPNEHSPDFSLLDDSFYNCDQNYLDKLNESIFNGVNDKMSKANYRHEIEVVLTQMELSICRGDSNQNRDDSQTSFIMCSRLNDQLMANANESTVMDDPAVCASSPRPFVSKGPFYDLPIVVEQIMKDQMGIDNLYEWQDECLKLEAVKNRKNLVYALPTSGGKTLVAELLLLRELLCRRKNVLFVLPFVAIVQEKVETFRNYFTVWELSSFAVKLNFLIEEYAANKGIYPPKKRRKKQSIFVATIEKALGLTNSLIEKNRLDEIGLVIVDELHLIGSDGRGGILEMLLANLMHIKADIQIIGMSATIGNIEEVARFLNAEIYLQNFRPVELIEYAKCGNDVGLVNYTSNRVFIPARHLQPTKNPDDTDHLSLLVQEATNANGSCLVFCATKKNCENVALLLTKLLDRNHALTKQNERSILRDALLVDNEMCCVLRQTIEFGVAYHHSGLTVDERRLIEDAFKSGVLNVLCCTSTLAAGVNLPAQRVIIRSPYVGRDFLTLCAYKQMIGRAGRKGLEERGESYLVFELKDLKKVKDMFHAPMNHVCSKLNDDGNKLLRRLVLNAIALSFATTFEQLMNLIGQTLLHVQWAKRNVNESIADIVVDIIEHLIVNDTVYIDEKNYRNLYDVYLTRESNNGIKLILSDDVSDDQIGKITEETDDMRARKTVHLKNDHKLAVTRFGKAAINGNFQLEDAHLLRKDLTLAKQHLILINDIHLLYLVTPYDMAAKIHLNQSLFAELCMSLNEDEMTVAKIIGIDAQCVMKLMRGLPVATIPQRVLARFFLTMILYDLWNEKPIFFIAEKYKIDRGLVQQLAIATASFAGNVIRFCESLVEDFWSFRVLLQNINDKLLYRCNPELIPLMDLPGVKKTRAIQLFAKGYKNLKLIARAKPGDLVNDIHNLNLFVAKQMISTARLLLLNKIENLREEVEEFMEGLDPTDIDNLK